MKKLLVIDDNLDFLGFLTSALEKYFEVYTATGVKDALRLLEYQKVEAICSDYNMKDGTGLDLLEDIRHKGISVPFLLMTCDDDYLIKQQAQFYVTSLAFDRQYQISKFTSAFILVIKLHSVLQQ